MDNKRNKPPKILITRLKPGESVEDARRRAEKEYKTLGKPGEALPWHQDEHGGWARLLTGGDRVIAIVDEYPPDLDGGYFYCVGDGSAAESSDDRFATAEIAKAAADARLRQMGYTWQKSERPAPRSDSKIS